VGAASHTVAADEIAVVEADSGRKSRVTAIDVTAVDYFDTWHERGSRCEWFNLDCLSTRTVVKYVCLECSLWAMTMQIITVYIVAV